MVDKKGELILKRGNTPTIKKIVFGKDIFLTGKYIQYFNPDDKRNPFSKLYDRKKRDAINILNHSQKSKTILDVGGGMGRLSLALAQLDQNKVVLTDISTDMLNLAASQAHNLRNLKVVNADAHQLPFKDGSFDYVVGLDLFCHLEKPGKALSEFHRVLVSHGMLILDSTNSNPTWTLFYPRYLGKNPLNWLKIIKFGGVYPGWQGIVKHYPKNKFFCLLQEFGFKIIRNINYGPAICAKWHLAVAMKNN